MSPILMEDRTAVELFKETKADQATQDARQAEAAFSPSEWNELRQDDATAARFVVGLMATIFTLGVLGYLSICIWVASS